jgi:type IV pilus assembly protein PilE
MHGFTLIELMITVVIIVILASVALPSYSDYVIRGKLSEATATLSDGRVRMEQYYQDNHTYVGGTCPASTESFTYACTNPGATPANTYTITATGKAGTNVSDFVFNINQANAKQTTGLKSGWGSAPVNCWITRKGGAC